MNMIEWKWINIIKELIVLCENTKHVCEYI